MGFSSSQVGHAIRTQVHIGGDDQIQFRAGGLFRREQQAADTPQELLRIAVGSAFPACLHLNIEGSGQFQSDRGKAGFLERCDRLLHVFRGIQPAFAVDLPVNPDRRTEPHPARTGFLCEVEQGCL
jgi:hypothetical protein